jgi:hypothetical protein
MMRVRLVLGLVATALGIVAGVAGARELVGDLRAANVLHAPGLVLAGLIGPALLLGLAGLSFRLAYRNLLWRRFVASARRARPISTASSDER